VKVQKALVDLGFSLGPPGTDGVYGSLTASAVKAFKREQHLGFEQFGDVGPGTMHRLDELFPGPLPPCPDDLVTAAEEGSKAKQLAVLIPGVHCQIRPPPTPGATCPLR
jgi:peptidoglycan hydrolase-like protein with peptidoglycan-binding domain